MSLDFPILAMSVPLIETKTGKPNAQLNLLWARLKKALEASDKAQQDTITQLQQQQALIVDIVALLAENVTYLNDLSDWQILMGQFVQQRVAYLQIAVADIATQGGFTIPDPSGLPVWPGPAPTPPF